MNLGLVVKLALAGEVLAALLAGFIYVKQLGRDELALEQQEKADQSKERTNAAKTDALTSDDPRSGLREYQRD